MRARDLTLALLVAALLVAAPAAAQWTLFAPHPFTNGATVELFGSQERQDFGPDTLRLGWNDRFLREKLTLFSEGYVYHPRFLLYHVSFSGALKQERYSSSLVSTGGKYGNRGTGLEYDTRFYLLPEHPYNLELFASRTEPLFRERSATHLDALETRKGADLRYRRRPLALGSRYTDDTVQSAGVDSTVRRLALSADYHQEFEHRRELSASAAYEPERFFTSQGLRGSGEDARVTSFASLGWGSLRTRVEREDEDQRDPLAGRLRNHDTNWEELLAADLPWRFHGDLLWRYRDDSTVTGAGGQPATELASTRRDIDATLSHRLYESLTSRYRFDRSTTSASFGDDTTTTNELAFDYTKRIPRGLVVLSSSWGRTESNTQGQVAVAQEPHLRVDVPGRFLLNASEVDPGSIVLLLKSPLPPFELVPLEVGTQYTLAAVGNQVEVTVFALPGRFAVPGTYDMVASYLTRGGFALRADDSAYSLGLHLWGDRVAPYFNHSTLDSKVLSGSFPGQALDSHTDVVGIDLREGPARLRLEHQDVRWNVGPYTARLAELQFVGALAENTTANATASYLTRDYPQGNGTQGPYSEVYENAGARLQQHLLQRRLTLTLGGTWSRITGLLDNEAYALDSTLSLKIGLIDLSAGATVTRSRSRSATLAATRLDGDTFYVRVRRTLF